MARVRLEVQSIETNNPYLEKIKGFNGTIIEKYDKNLVAYYTFNGNANDYSGNNNHGKEYGNIYYVTGINGNAAKFDGNDDYIRIPNSPSYNSKSITLTAWINIHRSFSGSGSDAIICKDYYSHTYPWYQFILFVCGNKYPRNSGTFGFKIAGKTNSKDEHFYLFTDFSFWEVGRWYFLAGTYSYEEELMCFYVDGVLIKQQKLKTEIHDYAKDVYIAKIGNRSDYLPAIIDEVRIYDYALNQNEILKLYRNDK